MDAGTLRCSSEAGRFLHGLAARIAARFTPPSFAGTGNPSPHPSPAALRAAFGCRWTSAPEIRVRPVDKAPRLTPATMDAGTLPCSSEAGRFLHGLAARIAARFTPPSFAGTGNPSPHPSPAALRAAPGCRWTSAPEIHVRPVDKAPRLTPATMDAGTLPCSSEAGRFLHGLAARIAARFTPPSFAGTGNPSPHPSPAALRAAPGCRWTSAPEIACGPWTKRPASRRRRWTPERCRALQRRGAFSTGWRRESLRDSLRRLSRGRETPPHTPPLRRFALHLDAGGLPHRRSACGPWTKRPASRRRRWTPERCRALQRRGAFSTG